MAEKETEHEPKDLIEVTPEALEKNGKRERKRRTQIC